MALQANTLVIAGTAVRDAITHFQFHSSAPGAAGTTGAVGSRVANTGTVNGTTGVITWSNIQFTGLTANQSVTHVSYWNASTAGTYRGSAALTGGDTAANVAGAYTVNSITETPSAT